MTAYLVLALAIICSVIQASLDKPGIGMIEELPSTPYTQFLTLISIPMMVLSNSGSIVIMIWSLFSLDLLTTLGVEFLALVLFSLVWGTFIGILRTSDKWEILVSASIPIVFVTRMICSISVLYLAYNYIQKILN